MVGAQSLPLHPADVAPIRDGERGYARQLVNFCIVYGARGQFVAVEDLLGWEPAGRSSMRMMLPERQHRDDGLSASFLWDTCRRPPTSPGWSVSARQQRADSARFEVYRTLHRKILQGVTDTPLVTFLKFLDGWGAEWCSHAREASAGTDARFVFRFQYDDEFLHERHAARLAWDRNYRGTFP